MKFSSSAAGAIAALFVLSTCVKLSLSAVLGVDLGSEYIKVASVKPGMGSFHIVVDEQTKRKFPTVVAFDGGERFFAHNGLAFNAKRPKETYQWHPLLLGESIDSPVISFFREEGWAYELISNSSRNGAIYIKHSEPNQDIQFLSAEELVAMNLQHVLKMAEIDAESPPGSMKDVVLTIPNYYTQTQRRALLDAAELAGMNVLSLIHENTAAAIQYGVDRKYDSSSINRSHTVLFYNMGSTSTQVDLAVYTGYQKGGGLKKENKTVGQVEMKASAYDNTLGGHAFEWAISKWIIEHITHELKKAGDHTDITSIPRAMAKIRTAAEKAKVVLSANSETPVFLSSVYNDMDFKLHITREHFYTLIKDLLARVAAPIENILSETGFKASDIDAVLIIGGSVRIPAVQQAIKHAMQREYLNQSLNGDEAMAFGALMRAANLSTTLQLRPFGMIDITPYPVGVRIQDLEEAASTETDVAATTAESTTASSDGEEGSFSKRASLFKRYNTLDKRKLVSFSHTRDFSASLFHDNPKLLPAGQRASICIYNVTGLTALVNDAKNAELLKTQKPRVSLSFELDASGLVTLAKAEATLEEQVQVCTPKNKKNTTARGDSNDSINNETNESNTQAGDQQEDDENSHLEKKEQDEISATKQETTEGEEEKEDNQKQDSDTVTSAGSTSQQEQVKEQEEQECITKKKSHSLKLKVKMGSSPGAITPLSKSDKSFMRARLNMYHRRDESKREIAAAKNTVESFIYSARSAVNEGELERVTTEQQRSVALAALEEAEDWLYDKREEETAETYNSKLSELKRLVDPMTNRLSELTKRPEMVETAKSLFENVRNQMKEYEKERPWVKAEDRDKLLKMIDDAETWLHEKEIAQASIASYDTPAFTSQEVVAVLRPIAKMTSDLEKLKKPIEKPKSKPKANATTTDANTTDSNPNVNTTATPDHDSNVEVENDKSTPKDEL